VETKKERIKTMPEQLEPVAPVLTAFVKHAGDTSGKTAEHALWVKDTEERQARGAAQETKRRELIEQASKPIDVVAELDAALNALEAGAVDFELSFGQPNVELVESKKIVAELTARLAEEQAKLDAIEARGDSVTRLSTAVAFAEGQLQALLTTTETEAINALARKHYGWKIGWDRISPEMKRDFRNHASVIALKKFYLLRHPRQTDNVEALKARLEAVGNKLAELRQHILDETSRHDTSAN
jgi:hypothetical protein